MYHLKRNVNFSEFLFVDFSLNENHFKFIVFYSEGVIKLLSCLPLKGVNDWKSRKECHSVLFL